MAAFEQDGMESISAEEKLAIASQFLLASPPGEIKDVLKDVKVLCSETVLSDDLVAEIFRQYNNQTNQVFTTGSQSIVCDEKTSIDKSHYMDFANNKVVKVDHMVQEITNEDVSDVPPIEVTEKLAEMREAVEANVTKYAAAQFIKGTTMVNVATHNGKLVVLISGEKLNLKNFWGGRWTSKYIVNIVGKELAGTVKLRIHYFEDGNVQMNTDKSIEDVPLSFDDAESLGTAVANAISSEEDAIQSSLEEMYVNMSDETFKDMRRILPITRQKMDWTGNQQVMAAASKGKK